MKLFEDYELDAMIEEEKKAMQRIRKRTKQKQKKNIWAKCFRVACFAWIIFTILVLLLHLLGKLPATMEKSTTKVVQSTIVARESTSKEKEKMLKNASEGSVEVLSEVSMDLLTTEIQSLQFTSNAGSIPGDDIQATEYASLEAMEADGYIPYEHSAVFIVTYYCGCSKCCGKYSGGSESEAYGALGTKLVPYYSIAVAPEVIPLGSIVKQADGTTYKAEDTGSAIKGNRIDVFTGDHEAALQLGIKKVELFW